MKKKIFISIFAFFAICSFAFIFFFSPFPKTSVKNETVSRIEVPNGMSVKNLAAILQNEKIIKNKTAFYLFARFKIFRSIFFLPDLHLESGVYHLKSSMSLREIFSLLSSGKQEYISLIFPEGFTISKIAKKLESANICSENDFVQATKNKTLIESFNVDVNTLEGFLFPDTYFFMPNMTAEKVVSMMVQNFFLHVNEIPFFKTATKKEFYDTVILASIVEREYRIADEAPLIASVFKNRLKNNVGLYSCATVEYIITEIQGKAHPEIITYEDLKIDNPYNTYKWRGLPPAPISNPGMTALKAASETPVTSYNYFRLIDVEKGKHTFSENFGEHIREGYSIKTKKE